MPITPDRLSRLREFGLSEYASRAYLALLDLGVAEARDVSTLSKVPQAKIYHVLEQLHEKGLAVILPEFPKKYAPVPFPEYLGRLQEEHERAAQAIVRDREVLAEMFRVVGDTEVGNRGFFTVIRGRRNVLTKIQEMINEAKRDVLILGTTGFAARGPSVANELDEARRRGATIRALVPITGETSPLLAPLAQIAEIRAREVEDASQSSRVAIIIVDGARAFLINFLPDDDNLYAGKDIGVYTDQEAMVAALATLVEPHWRTASPLATRNDELATGRAAETTIVYSDGNEMILALRKALARGFREARVLDGLPAEAPTDVGLDLARAIRDAGAKFRALLNVKDQATGQALANIAAQGVGSEVRHHAPRGSSRYWLIDDKEAFFSIAQPGIEATASDVVVHTTSPGVVRALSAHFESEWQRAVKLEARLHEMNVFPHVQPRDIGIGWLFDEMKEAVVVANEEGRIVLWNPAASETFGHTVEEALRLDITHVLPDAATHALDATTGARFDLLALRAQRKDGERFDAEVTLAPASDLMTGKRYAVALIRESARARRLLDVGADETARAPRR